MGFTPHQVDAMEVWHVAVLLGADQRDDFEWQMTEADMERMNTPLPTGTDLTASVLAGIQGQRR